MTDNIRALVNYRLEQADESLPEDYQKYLRIE